MCGIAGYIGKREISPEDLDRTLQLMKNRGPDHQKWVRVKEPGRNVYFLHSRLSIIDLDPRSHQPFFRNGVWLAYNGEIYNYREVREELEKDGAVFTTSSDTEVLLEAYLRHGEACVEKFEGMWAFAIYDTRDRKLFLSRDRFAEKPLYFVETPDGFYFGSEVKFLKALSGRSFPVNRKQVLRYLVNGYKALYKQPETYFDGIREIPFATSAVISQEGRLRLDRYWQPVARPQAMTMAEAVEGARHHLVESMRIRLRADVPLAFCLSGGVDSASLVSIAAKEFGYDAATFSIIDSDERYNEFDNIRATIDDLGCKHTLIHLECGDTLKHLRELVAYHDAPVATITYLVHSYLSRAIHEAGYRVAFSGTSADELFTGYYDHFYLHLYEMRGHPDYPKLVADWQEHTGKFVRNPFFKNPELYFQDPGFRGHIYLNNDVYRSYLKVPFEEGFIEEQMDASLLRSRMLNELFYEATPVVLHEDDLNSMKYSVENRSPFLDTRLYEFAYSIPKEHLIRDGYGKYVLREAVKGVLNDRVRLDRRKKGFNASISSILDFDSPQVIEELLSDSPLYDIVDREKVRPLFKSGAHEDSANKFLFNLVNAKIFLEQNS
jgi:asparagine synthase (glutamine-hydrolysing)